jgi:hypothetical protein
MCQDEAPTSSAEAAGSATKVDSWQRRANAGDRAKSQKGNKRISIPATGAYVAEEHRNIKETGVPDRRTVRKGLWTGPELLSPR